MAADNRTTELRRSATDGVVTLARAPRAGSGRVPPARRLDRPRRPAAQTVRRGRDRADRLRAARLRHRVAQRRRVQLSAAPLLRAGRSPPGSAGGHRGSRSSTWRCRSGGRRRRWEWPGSPWPTPWAFSAGTLLLALPSRLVAWRALAKGALQVAAGATPGRALSCGSRRLLAARSARGTGRRGTRGVARGRGRGSGRWSRSRCTGSSACRSSGDSLRGGPATPRPEPRREAVRTAYRRASAPLDALHPVVKRLLVDRELQHVLGAGDSTARRRAGTDTRSRSLAGVRLPRTEDGEVLVVAGGDVGQMHRGSRTTPS